MPRRTARRMGSTASAPAREDPQDRGRPDDRSPQGLLVAGRGEPRQGGGTEELILPSSDPGQRDEQQRRCVNVEPGPVTLARLVAKKDPGAVKKRVKAVGPQVGPERAGESKGVEHDGRRPARHLSSQDVVLDAG